MRRIKNVIFLIPSVFLLLFVGCSPDEMEFARPSTLEGPIFQQLVELGDYDHYVECLKRTEYAAPLSTGGSWTAFVPSDSAFEIFLKENNYSSVQDMPLLRVQNIVKHSLIIDAYNTTLLTFYPSGWYAGNSFRKLSQYKDSLQIIPGSDYPSFEDVEDKDYLVDMSKGRVKTLAYWLDAYVDGTRNSEIARSDYSFMFPGQENMVPGQMKMYDAHVNKANIISENGLIYELDKVLEPKANLYQNLTAEEYGDKYSIFKGLIDRFGYFRYMGRGENPYNGNSNDSLFQIRYSTGITNNLLAFDPSDESMPKLLNNVDRTEANATGLLVPTNTALLNYLNEDNEVAKNYSSYDDMPLDVVALFLNVNFFTHYWNVCPSHFGSSFNVGLEEVVIQEGDVVDSKFCSNGMFVGVNKVYPTKSFATVYGPLVLDTTYSIMLESIKDLGLDNSLKGTGINFSILGLQNNQFVNIPDPNHATRKITVVGYEPDMSVIYLDVTNDPEPSNNRIYPDPNASKPSSSDIDYVKETLNDIVLNQIIEEKFEENNFYQTKKGAFVYLTDGLKVQGGGDIQDDVDVNLETTKETTNGQFFVTDKFVNPPKQYTYGALTSKITTLGMFRLVLISAGARLDIPGYSFDYLISFLDLRRTYTLLAPNNAAITKAVQDGVDLEAPSQYAYGELKNLVKNGEIDLKVVDMAVRRILMAKYKAGLFDRPFKVSDDRASRIHTAEHVKHARTIAEESIVLLKNTGGILPLDKRKVKSMAVIGPNANQVQFGDYSITKSNDYGVTLLQGIQQVAGSDITINYARGCGITDLDTLGFERAIEIAQKSDVIVLAIGGTSSIYSGIGWGNDELDKDNTCGEGFDRTMLNPPGVQSQLIRALEACGKPIVLVMIHGRPYSIPWEKQHLPAIVEAWYPGEQGGLAMADVLFGNINPSGKLPISVPQSVGHLPTVYDYKPTGRGYYHKRGTPEKPGRDYVFSSPDALFCFGHGLSYTTFEYTNIELNSKEIQNGESVRISVSVQNSGSIKGKEVVQLYIRDQVSSVTTPVKMLKGFQKIELEPGQSKIVEFTVDFDALSLWNMDMKKVVEPGAFEVHIGSSSDDIRLKSEFVVAMATP